MSNKINGVVEKIERNEQRRVELLREKNLKSSLVIRDSRQRKKSPRKKMISAYVTGTHLGYTPDAIGSYVAGQVLSELEIRAEQEDTIKVIKSSGSRRHLSRMTFRDNAIAYCVKRLTENMSKSIRSQQIEIEEGKKAVSIYRWFMNLSEKRKWVTARRLNISRSELEHLVRVYHARAFGRK